MYWILLLLLCVIPAFRMVFGRMTASITQFSWMQPQIIPSFLYFCTALVLLFHLLRRTTKPAWVPAVLLLIPLVLDCWYLFPDSVGALSPTAWLNIGSGLKIAVSVFALFMSLRAKMNPALIYKEAEKIDG